MTHISLRRRLAYQESMVLRGYARWNRPPAPCRPLDYWNEWMRQQHAT